MRNSYKKININSPIRTDFLKQKIDRSELPSCEKQISQKNRNNHPRQNHPWTLKAFGLGRDGKDHSHSK